MLSERRHARYGYLLGLHILLLCARGYTATEIAAGLLCSRSSVYRTVAAYRRGAFNGWQATPAAAVPTLCSWQRSLLALLQRTPHA
jgi:transposase